jgi:precorrin-6A/cobalt-precorrin-6A reductase
MAPGARRVLLLGGSTEATHLARLIAAAGGIDLTVSFAGRTATRAEMPNGVTVRVGGFGGPDGLRRHLEANAVDALVDATHPFSARMPFHAATAAGDAGVPRVRLLRPPWAPRAGDRWTAVSSVTEAAAAVEASGARGVLLTIGRQALAPFVACRRARLVARCIDPPDDGVLDGAEVILARGPFTVEDEVALMRRHHIDLVVSKNAGGAATEAKLVATRTLGLPVVMVERPPAPDGPTVATPTDAVKWLDAALLERAGR